jgi:hypothetical protein
LNFGTLLECEAKPHIEMKPIAIGSFKVAVKSSSTYSGFQVWVGGSYYYYYYFILLTILFFITFIYYN